MEREGELGRMRKRACSDMTRRSVRSVKHILMCVLSTPSLYTHRSVVVTAIMLCDQPASSWSPRSASVPIQTQTTPATRHDRYANCFLSTITRANIQCLAGGIHVGGPLAGQTCRAVTREFFVIFHPTRFVVIGSGVVD